MAFTIYSFGEIEFWDQFLGAIKNVIGSGDYAVVLALFLSLGLVWKALNEGKNPGGIAWYFITLAVLTGLIKGSTDVIIRDEILNQDRSVRNVPIIVALPAYLITNIDRALTEIFETAFSLPSGVKYLDFGYNLGAYAFKDTFKFTKFNAYYDRSWTNFVKDCVVPSISGGKINANDLIHSSNVETVLDNVNPAYTTEYCDLSGNCRNMYCDDAWNHIKQDTRRLLNTARHYYAAKVLTEKGIYNRFTEQKLRDTFTNISDYFLNYSVDLNNYIKQALTIHQLAHGFKQNLSSDDLIIKYMEETAKVKTNSMLIALGELAGEYIPLIKKLLLLLLFGSIPLLFALLYVDFLRSKALFSFFTVALSLTFWEPLFAILNFIISIIQQNQYQACEIGTNAISMVHFACLTSDATTMSAVAGALAWSIPTLALGLAGGSAYAIVHGMGGILSRASGGVSGAISSPEGAESVGKTYAKMEEAQRLGFDYKTLLKTESQTYTQASAAKMLALGADNDFFLKKSELDIAKSWGGMKPYETPGGNIDFSKAINVSSTNAQRDIGHAEALQDSARLFGTSIEGFTRGMEDIDNAKAIYQNAIVTGDTRQAEEIHNIIKQNLGKNGVLKEFKQIADVATQDVGIKISKNDAEEVLSKLGLEGKVSVLKTGHGLIVKTSDGRTVDLIHFLATEYAKKGDLKGFINTLHQLYQETGKEIHKGLTHRHLDNLNETPEGKIVGVANGLLGLAALKGIYDFLKKNYPKVSKVIENLNLDRKVGRALGLITLFPEAKGEHLKELRAIRDELKKELFTKDELKELNELSKKARSGDTKAAMEYLRRWEEKLAEFKRTSPEKFNQIAEKVSQLTDLRSVDALAKQIETKGVAGTKDLAKDVFKGVRTLEGEASVLKNTVKLGAKSLALLDGIQMVITAPNYLKANDDINYLFRGNNTNKAAIWQGINASDWVAGGLIPDSVYPNLTESDINPYYAGYLLTAADTPLAKALKDNMPKPLIEKSLNTYLRTLDTQKVAVIQTKDGGLLPIYVDQKGNVYNLRDMQEAGFKIEKPDNVPAGAMQYKIGYYQDGQLHLYNPDTLKGEKPEEIFKTIRDTVMNMSRVNP
jgi:hypothetical protein